MAATADLHGKQNDSTVVRLQVCNVALELVVSFATETGA